MIRNTRLYLHLFKLTPRFFASPPRQQLTSYIFKISKKVFCQNTLFTTISLPLVTGTHVFLDFFPIWMRMRRFRFRNLDFKISLSIGVIIVLRSCLRLSFWAPHLTVLKMRKGSLSLLGGPQKAILILKNESLSLEIHLTENYDFICS